MARSMSQTLIRTSQSSFLATKPPPPQHFTRLVAFRNQSSQSENSHVVDPNHIDPETEKRNAPAVRRIEDAIHRIIVKRLAPDWLPFYPGASYWVPPKRESYGIAEIFRKMSNSLNEEEVMSLTMTRGWPSATFFVDGAPSNPPEIETSSKSISKSEDEEG
ncbi:unnamed protein product [Ilex paraguariensis]|uniref:Uncharacterized protein n=1 Tax=Ilex paraguariensis TaxID=185542 RepID=A0ABC8RVT0_9AQUA